MALDAHIFLLSIVIILVAARIFAELAARIQIPPVIGELVAGIVLGPSLLGWVAPTEALRLLAEIGIILLLFEVGLETDVRELARAGAKSLTVAAAGVVLPFLLGFGLARWGFGLGLLPALFIGGTLTATSIGITVRVLNELGLQKGEEGQIVLGAAVIDDVIGVILLAVLYEFATKGGVDLFNVGRVLLFVGVFFVLAPPLAKLFALVIARFDKVSEIPGLVPTTIVALVLFFAWLAHVVEVPQLLGGFAAGLALSRRFFLPFGVAIRTDEHFAHQIETQMKPIVHLFTPIFFVMVGLALNLRDVSWGSSFIWAFSLALLVVAIIGKVVGGLIVGGPWLSRLTIGLAMVPRGEVGLVFAELGRASGILDTQVYAGVIIVIALTTLGPPFVLKWLHPRPVKTRVP